MTLSAFLGKAIKAQRKSRRITLTEIAHKTNLNQGTLSRYETGALEVSLESICQICSVFDMRPSDLVRQAEDMELSYAKEVMKDPRMQQLFMELTR